jgi:cytochrome P450
MRAGIQRIADNLLDAINGPVDLIEAYAAPLPIIAIAELLGVPADRVDDFRGWTNTLVTQGPGTRDAVVSMYRFTVGLIAAKRDDPADDLISAMIEARDGSDRLTEDELLSLAFLILWAGYENSVHLIGNSVLTLLTGSASTIETLLRSANPNLHAIRRFPLADIEVDGVTIPAGQTVLLDIDGANRDPRHLDDPHVSFGAGVHHCLGAPMARLEAEIAIDSLFRRFPEVRLAVHPDELRWRDSFRSRGLLELPVTGTG